MKYIVDRIEEDYAICEEETTKIVSIKLSDLPFKIHEGSIFEKTGKNYILHLNEEEQRRKAIREKINHLKNISKTKKDKL